MTPLETQIVDIPEDALNDLFDETPEKTVNADVLLGGKAPEKEEESKETKEEKKETKETKKATLPTNEIENISTEDLDEEEEEEENKSKKEVKAETKEVKETKKETKEEEAKANPEVSSVLKSTVDYLVQQGLWSDWDGREEMEFTEEDYAKLVAAQDTFRVQSMFSEMIDKTGPYGKAIIDFVQNGGNPDEVISLFKEQKQVESINITSPEGQKDLIRHYYSDVLEWKPERIDKYINNLVVNDELENEAKETKDLFTNHYKKQVEARSKEAEEFAVRQREAEKAFEQNIRGTIKERKDLTPSEKRTVEEYLLAYDQRLPDGNLVNKFYVNFAQMQQNPKDYIDLVLFVMDKNKYIQKVQQQEKNKATDEAFRFIKGNGAVSTKKGTTHEQLKKMDKTSQFDWGFPSR